MKHSLIILISFLLLSSPLFGQSSSYHISDSPKYESVGQCVIQTMTEKKLTGNQMFEMVKEECERILGEFETEIGTLTHPSWGDWNYIRNEGGNTFYYDKDLVRKSGKFIYVWELIDFGKPVKEKMNEYLSFTRYVQIDCSIFRYKDLKFKFYKKIMGQEGDSDWGFTPPFEWKYPQPESVGESMYNKICKEHQ